MERDQPVRSGGSAPPTGAGPVGRARPGLEGSGWPKVLGVVLIVLCSLAALGGALGVLSATVLAPLFKGLFAGMPGGQASTAMMDATKVLSIVVSGLALGVAVVGVVAGAKLVSRRRSGVGVAKAWAWLKIVYAAPAAWLMWANHQAQMEALRQQVAQGGGGGGGAMGVSMAQAIGPISLVIGTVWTVALPVFVLVWMSRKKIKDEVARGVEWR